MSWFTAKLSNLQNKPYKARLKILKIAVVIVTMILLIIWTVTIKYRHRQKNPDQKSQFTPILENLKKLKDARP